MSEKRTIHLDAIKLETKKLKNGGKTYVVRGRNTSGKRYARLLKVKNYRESYAIDVSIGPENSDTARAAINLSIEEATEAVVALIRAIEYAEEYAQ